MSAFEFPISQGYAHGKKQNKKVVDKCKIYKNGSIGNVSQSENTILYSAGLCKVNEFGINFHGNKAERQVGV
jgi:hypothetical protein